MNPKAIGIGTAALAAAGIAVAIILSPAGPAVIIQLPDGGTVCTGACFDAGAPVLFAVQDLPTGKHATVAQQCQPAAVGLTCDFADTSGAPHKVIVLADGGLNPVLGGALNVIVQAPDGGWVAQ